MYLSLRTNNVDTEDQNTGMNVFSIYLMQKDTHHMKRLLMRGADINYVNKRKKETPLHTAIEHKLDSKIVKFLLKHGANHHIVDEKGLDCCDKAMKIERYGKIKAFKNMDC